MEPRGCNRWGVPGGRFGRAFRRAIQARFGVPSSAASFPPSARSSLRI
jgi:hypothetical protein